MGLCDHSGFDFRTINVQTLSGHIAVQLWDTSGDEQCQGILTHSYFKGSHGVFLVYDAFNSSGDQLSQWVEDIRLHSDGEVEIILICNKIDLLPHGKANFSGQVRSGNQIAVENKIKIYLVSARTGFGCAAPLHSMVNTVLNSSTFRSADVDPSKAKKSCRTIVSNCCTIT